MNKSRPMNLSEGDVVVTPEGDVYEIVRTVIGSQPIGKKGNEQGKIKFWEDDLIKTASPLRVRVDHEADAKVLISRAEEAGFGFPDQIADIRDKGKYAFIPDGKAIKHSLNISGEKEYLTYPQESRQIIGWLNFHASEDDDQQWESPEPSDPAWREAFLERAKPDGDIANTRETGLALGIDSYSEAIADIFDYIDRLEDYAETMLEWGILNRDGAKELKEKVESLEAKRDEYKEALRSIEHPDRMPHNFTGAQNLAFITLNKEQSQ